MTDHPITPPPELVQQWLENSPEDDELGIAGYIATQAARWGADQELEACLEWLNFYAAGAEATDLRAARRPQPPSLKEQALAALARLKSGALCADRVTDESIIRRALEQLDG